MRVQESSDEIPSGSMPRRYDHRATVSVAAVFQSFASHYPTPDYVSSIHCPICSVDIILRHQAVEKAKAGDKVTFTGTLIVVPDVAQLSGSGPLHWASKLHLTPWYLHFVLLIAFFLLFHYSPFLICFHLLCLHLAGRSAIMSRSGQREGYSEEGVTGLSVSHAEMASSLTCAHWRPFSFSLSFVASFSFLSSSVPLSSSLFFHFLSIRLSIARSLSLLFFLFRCLSMLLSLTLAPSLASIALIPFLSNPIPL